MLTISREHALGILSDKNERALECNSGDIVRFETRDCFDDSIVTENGPTLPRMYSNPVTGPLFVNGAMPGDILKIDILKLEVADTGIIRTTPNSIPFDDVFEDKTPRIYRIQNGKIIFDEKLSLEPDIMIGVIATAPANSEQIDTKTPGAHGGNMDCRRITQGCSVYLPVNTEGALLCIGDLHALMGDGEVATCGMECRGAAEVRVSVLKGESLPTPSVVNGEKFMSVQSAQTLEQAATLASRTMRDMLIEKCGIDTIAACFLLSMVGDLAICQVVDPLMTVRMEVPLSVLDKYGVKLP